MSSMLSALKMWKDHFLPWRTAIMNIGEDEKLKEFEASDEGVVLVAEIKNKYGLPVPVDGIRLHFGGPGGGWYEKHLGSEHKFLLGSNDSTHVTLMLQPEIEGGMRKKQTGADYIG